MPQKVHKALEDELGPSLQFFLFLYYLDLKTERIFEENLLLLHGEFAPVLSFYGFHPCLDHDDSIVMIAEIC